MRTRPRRTLLVGSAAAACVLGAACMRTVGVDTVEVAQQGMGDLLLGPATNLPPTFDVITPAARPGECPARLADSGLGTALTLRRAVSLPVRDSAGVSHRAYGDYGVEPAGAYGDRPGEGLRIDCGRLRVLGLVVLGGT